MHGVEVLPLATQNPTIPGPSNSKGKGKTEPEAPQETTYRPRNLKPLSCLDAEIPRIVEAAMFQEPFIRDPGNSPRVRDASAFMGSFFTQPAALDVS